MGKWPTPDNPPAPLTVTRAVLLPADTQYLAAINGAISELANPDNWEQVGTQTPEDTADFWLRVLIDWYG